MFWDKVKQEIKAQNTTQEWLAKACGVSFRTLSGWIYKGRLPSVDEGLTIAKALGVTVEYLVTGDTTGIKSQAYRALERRLASYTDAQLEQADRILEVALPDSSPNSLPLTNQQTG